MFPTISEIVFFGLVCWRITSLLVSEDGPWDVFAKLRARIGVYYDARSVAQGRNVIAKALTCVWCTSIWVSIPLATLYAFDRMTADHYKSANIRTWMIPEILPIFCFAMAISAITIFIDSIVETLVREIK